jgi:hypothetical protein
MISAESKAIIEAAERFYEDQLRPEMEAEHAGEFLAIEPQSGCYFLGSTFGGAVRAAREAFPDRVTFTLQIGKPAALQLGVMSL